MTTKWIKNHYRKPTRIRVGINGHGYLINRDREAISELRSCGVDSVCVSLNAHDEKTYNMICEPQFKQSCRYVLELVRLARKCLDVEVTAVNITEINLEELTKIAGKLGAKFRLRQYIPCLH